MTISQNYETYFINYIDKNAECNKLFLIRGDMQEILNL